MEMSEQRTEVKASFARVFGSAGEAPRMMGLLKAFWPFMVICLLLGYLLRAVAPVPVFSVSQLGLLFILLAMAGLVLLAWGNRRLRNYLKGAKGEEWVARELAFLPSQFAVFHGVRLPGGAYNFDHILVGPGGVFVVETKNWSGSVAFREGKTWVDGKQIKRSPLRQVKGEAAELLAYFKEQGEEKIRVQTVLCFLGSELAEQIANVNGVVVCEGDALVDVLTDELNAEFDLADRAQAEQLLIPLVG
jgi:hypothetical protein